VPSTFTVHLPASTTVSGAVIITPELLGSSEVTDDRVTTSSDIRVTTSGDTRATSTLGGSGGAFSPPTVTLSTGSPSATFTYTPGSAGTKTISFTNTGDLLDPADLSFLAVVYATGYSMSGPSAGDVGSASSAFTVRLTPLGDPVPATVTVTDDAGDGGIFTPTTVALTFTFCHRCIYAASAGLRLLPTNNGGLTDPGDLTYTRPQLTFVDNLLAQQHHRSHSRYGTTGIVGNRRMSVKM
jgi:hypothetical protein